MRKALVSVIIPVYNREMLVTEAINSVFKQSYRPIECILIDDGSSDNSVSVINELKKVLESKDFSMQVLIQENAGAPAARNTGLKRACGEFVQFLDSDDVLYPNKLEHQDRKSVV
jgi:UDP-glucose:(glucosyl)LPS beta-1,3-glucosyltransferase